MAKFKAKYHKIASDGSVVTIYREHTGGWYVGKPGNDLAYHPTPMGAFSGVAAAQRWADRLFPGGTWERGAFKERRMRAIDRSRARTRGLQGA